MFELILIYCGVLLLENSNLYQLKNLREKKAIAIIVKFNSSF